MLDWQKIQMQNVLFNAFIPSGIQISSLPESSKLAVQPHRKKSNSGFYQLPDIHDYQEGLNDIRIDSLKE